MANTLISGGGGSTSTGTSATQVQGNAASGATDVGNPVKTGAKYNATPPTFTDGQRADTQADVSGNTKVTLATLIAGENLTFNRMQVLPNYNYGRVTADGAIKSAAGYVHTVTFAGTGAITAGVITIYDNTAESGTVIWSGTIQVAANPTTIILDTAFGTGLFVGYDGTIQNVSTTVAYL